MLMDATVATGAAAMMAIRVLLDHDVPEENILLLSLIMAESGNMLAGSLNLLYQVHFVLVVANPGITYATHVFAGNGHK
jgi:uridine kinase